MRYVMKKNNFSYNYSIAFMKAFFSFCVVCCHFWNSDNIGLYPVDMMYRMRGAAVHVFIIISFYLMGETLSSKEKAKKRVYRLLVPYLGWGVIYYYAYWIMGVVRQIIGNSRGNSIVSYKDLLWQLALGSSRYLCPVLWYHFNLIILTVLFVIVFSYSRDYIWINVVILGLLAFWLQYSGINYWLFGRFGFEVRYSLGRIVELLPSSCLGLLLAKSQNLNKIKEHGIVTVFICIVTMILISYYDVISDCSYSFYYGGLKVVMYSTLAYLLFWVIPFEAAPEWMKTILFFAAKYSLGVYCVHLAVGHCWDSYACKILGLGNKTFFGSMVIYLLSLAVSFVISKIPFQSVKNLVS